MIECFEKKNMFFGSFRGFLYFLFLLLCECANNFFIFSVRIVRLVCGVPTELKTRFHCADLTMEARLFLSFFWCPTIAFREWFDYISSLAFVLKKAPIKSIPIKQSQKKIRWQSAGNLLTDFIVYTRFNIKSINNEKYFY